MCGVTQSLIHCWWECLRWHTLILENVNSHMSYYFIVCQGFFKAEKRIRLPDNPVVTFMSEKQTKRSIQKLSVWVKMIH